MLAAVHRRRVKISSANLIDVVMVHDGCNLPMSEAVARRSGTNGR